jgi:exonuclease VII large subunit
LEQARAKLELLSPKSTLERGYSITRLTETGQIVRNTSLVKTGSNISTMVLDGEFRSVVSSEPEVR